MALWSSEFIRLSMLRYDRFHTFGFDLGIYDQGIWLLSRAKDPFVTIRGLEFFGHHTNIALVVRAVLPARRGPDLPARRAGAGAGERRDRGASCSPRDCCTRSGPASDSARRSCSIRRIDGSRGSTPSGRDRDRSLVVHVLGGAPAAMGMVLVRGRV